MPRRIANVWAAACPTCHAQVNAGCVNLSAGPHRLLFGRRTHKERAKAVKAMATVSLTSGTITAGSLTVTGADLTSGQITFINGTGDGWFNLGPYTTTTTASTTIPNYTGNQVQTYAYADQVWEGWVDAGHTVEPQYYYNQPVWNAWVEDDEQRIVRLERERQQRDELQARREQQNRERLAREQEQMENHLVAHARALELLDDLLTEEERALRQEENRVAVRGSDGHLYWIEMHNESVHGNIVRTDEHGCRLGRACVAPRMYDGLEVLPTPDGWVGQYLGLKFDAETFLSHANWSGRAGCQQPAEYVIEAA